MGHIHIVGERGVESAQAYHGFRMNPEELKEVLRALNGRFVSLYSDDRYQLPKCGLLISYRETARVLGWYDPRRRLICLHKPAWDLGSLAHEFAHHLAYHLNHDGHHGPAFKFRFREVLRFLEDEGFGEFV